MRFYCTVLCTSLNMKNKRRVEDSKDKSAHTTNKRWGLRRQRTDFGTFGLPLLQQAFVLSGKWAQKWRRKKYRQEGSFLVFAWRKGAQFGTLIHYWAKTDIRHIPALEEKKMAHCYNSPKPWDYCVLISVQPDVLSLISAVMRDTVKPKTS